MEALLIFLLMWLGLYTGPDAQPDAAQPQAVSVATFMPPAQGGATARQKVGKPVIGNLPGGPRTVMIGGPLVMVDDVYFRPPQQ